MWTFLNISYPQVKTRSILESIEPTWNDEFIVELEGSENVRILAYEETKTQGTVLRGKATLELSRWARKVAESNTIASIYVIDTCVTCHIAPTLSRRIRSEETDSDTKNMGNFLLWEWNQFSKTFLANRGKDSCVVRIHHCQCPQYFQFFPFSQI